uniref:Uncharacterized protein n=1 Tax=Ixodes ricinus TaxID=34613 RepID=A0A0K8R6W7_IXORI
MLLSLFVFVTGKPFSVVFYAGEFSAECLLPRVRLCVNVCWLVCVRFQPPLIRFPPSLPTRLVSTRRWFGTVTGTRYVRPTRLVRYPFGSSPVPVRRTEERRKK